MIDAEVALLRAIPSEEPMIVQVDGQAIADRRSLERIILSLEGFRQMGWIELETWPAKGRPLVGDR
ncbi:MAG: hypothetical protein H0T86_09495 [Gemmatimonadales bacterium]|nr:hypothetical protein [Gemmatimonadales bacterium]